MAENRGMPVADMTQLRAKARASGVYFRVVKNTLVRRAVADTPFAALADKMVGPLAYGIGSRSRRRGEGPERLRQGHTTSS